MYRERSGWSTRAALDQRQYTSTRPLRNSSLETTVTYHPPITTMIVDIVYHLSKWEGFFVLEHATVPL